ncbi:MAG: hypothetical protein ACOX2F_10790 [bacterium]
MVRIISSVFFSLLIFFHSFSLYSDEKAIEQIHSEKEKQPQIDLQISAEDEFSKKPAPFDEKAGQEINILEVDLEIVAGYNEAVRIEKSPDSADNLEQLIDAWKAFIEKEGSNPFLKIAEQRLNEWTAYRSYLLEFNQKKEETYSKLEKILAAEPITYEQKESAVATYIDEYGLAGGIKDVLKLMYSENKEILMKILESDTVKNKILIVMKKRCEKGDGQDCYAFSESLKPGSDEKIVYLKKSCELNFQAGCEKLKTEEEGMKAEEARLEQERIKAEEAKKEEERIKAEQEKKEKEKIELAAEIEKELNVLSSQRKKAAISTLVTGVVLAAAGGSLFYPAWIAEKNKKDAYREYLTATTQEQADRWRKNTKKHKRNKLLYNTFGGIGVGLGAVAIITGTTLFFVKTQKEKDAEKKYDFSIYANPFDQSFGLTFFY